jgi:glycosyltransferase involved in cell wall biosynthesis
LANALAKLIDNPNLCKKLGQAGRQTVLNKFTLQANTQKLATHFTHSLQHGNSSR